MTITRPIPTLLLLFAFIISTTTYAQKWVSLNNKFKQPAGGTLQGVSLMLLLPDGTVMAQICSAPVACGTQWAKLTPDEKGSYQNGKWTMLAPMKFQRTSFSTQVLRDGRVFVIGGEQTNNIGGGQGEMYNPGTDTWTLTSTIPVALFDPSTKKGNEFDDAQSMMLPDGRILFAPVHNSGITSTLIYDPVTDIWTAGGNFFNHSTQDEATWIKLADGSIIVPDIDGINSERYIPSSNSWIADATIPVSAQLYAQQEVGPGSLLPNGKVFISGSSGNTAIYTPGKAGAMGSWVAGPVIPNKMLAADVSAAMMPNGKILLATGPNIANGGTLSPTLFFEYDFSAGPVGSFAATGSPHDNTPGSQLKDNASNVLFLNLPDGNILVTEGANSDGQLYLYEPAGPSIAAGKPVITSITANADGSYHLTGTGLNGISQGSDFGDDFQMDSNYPIVRLKDKSGNVYYCRTFNWSNTGVMTGNSPVSTEFVLPQSILVKPQSDTYSLEVVTNGIPSDPRNFKTPFEFSTFRWNGVWGSDGPVYTGDFNGDGKTDMAIWRKAENTWGMNLSTGKGFNTAEWNGIWQTDGPVYFGDFNGDGKTDMAVWRKSENIWGMNLSTGKGFNTGQWNGVWQTDGPVYIGDFNGDGKTDMAIWRKSENIWGMNLSTGNGFNTGQWNGVWQTDGPVYVGDFNGDGKTDLIVWRKNENKWGVNLSTGNGFKTDQWDGVWQTDGPTFTGDFNGDGKTDIIVWRTATNTWGVNLSTGSGFNASEWTGTWGSDGPIFTGDLNGDGKTDVFVWRKSSNSWMVNISTGKGFIQQEWKGMWGSDGPIFTGDLNGDHKTDIFMWNAAGNNWSINITP